MGDKYRRTSEILGRCRCSSTTVTMPSTLLSKVTVTGAFLSLENSPGLIRIMACTLPVEEDTETMGDAAAVSLAEPVNVRDVLKWS